METRTVELYTLEELKIKAPEVFERIHEKWADNCTDDVPWTEETMDSLRAVIEAAGGELRDWSIGAYSSSRIKVSVNDEYEDEEGNEIVKDAEWFLREVLAPNGYVNDKGEADFPGHCKFTGYCADDDFLESAWKAICEGSTLTEALEQLADDASRMMEDNLEQDQSEESMLANWGENLYTIDGTEM